MHRRGRRNIPAQHRPAKKHPNKPPNKEAPTILKPKPASLTASLTGPSRPGTFIPQLPTREPLQVRLSPGLQDCCSISHVNRNLALALYHAEGVDVCWQPDAIPKVECASYVGRTHWMKGEPQGPHVTIGWVAHLPSITAQERGRLLIATSDHGTLFDDRVVAMLTTSDVTGLLSLSPGCTEALERIVPAEMIYPLPLGVDASLCRTDGPSFDVLGAADWLGQHPDEGAFTFLVAGYIQPRKGFSEVAEAFCQAFGGRRDVALVIKAVVERHGHSAHGRLATLAAEHGYPCIGYIEGAITEYELAALYRSCDCLVNAHHREGFGLPPLEAMACGTPIIVTDYHGPQQYARAENAYLLKPSSIEPERTLQPGQEHRIDWAYYDLDDLAQLMVEAEQGKRRKTIIRAGLAEAKKWTWERTAKAALKACDELVGNIRRRPRKWHSPLVDFSVVVCCRNGAKHLRAFMDSLPPLPAHSELLVLDDASEPEEAGRMKEICERRGGVRLIRSEKQLGIGGSRARLYEEVRGRFICSLDADLIFTDTDPHWLERLRGLWNAGDGKFGILGTLLLWPNGKVQNAGAYACWDAATHFELRGTNEPLSETWERPAIVSALSGAVHFFRQDLLDHCQMDGGYFPSFFEDADFCMQARVAGYEMRYSPEVRIIHNAQSWCGSAEGAKQAQLAMVRERFEQRWADMIQEDERRQDEAGALEYPCAAPKKSPYAIIGGGNEHLGLAVTK